MCNSNKTMKVEQVEQVEQKNNKSYKDGLFLTLTPEKNTDIREKYKVVDVSWFDMILVYIMMTILIQIQIKYKF